MLDDIPIFLFMKCVGNRPPAMVPAKGVYMIKDIQRMQEYYGIPIIPPSVSVDIKILSFRWVGIETEIQWLCGSEKKHLLPNFLKSLFVNNIILLILIKRCMDILGRILITSGS